MENFTNKTKIEKLRDTNFSEEEHKFLEIREFTHKFFRDTYNTTFFEDREKQYSINREYIDEQIKDLKIEELTPYYFVTKNEFRELVSQFRDVYKNKYKRECDIFGSSVSKIYNAVNHENSAICFCFIEERSKYETEESFEYKKYKYNGNAIHELIHGSSRSIWSVTNEGNYYTNRATLTQLNPYLEEAFTQCISSVCEKKLFDKTFNYSSDWIDFSESGIPNKVKEILRRDDHHLLNHISFSESRNEVVGNFQPYHIHGLVMTTLMQKIGPHFIDIISELRNKNYTKDDKIDYFKKNILPLFNDVSVDFEGKNYHILNFMLHVHRNGLFNNEDAQLAILNSVSKMKNLT